MPVPEDRLYQPDKLNRWFAVASVLMTASFIWMSYVDYARPWRDYQDNYFLSKAALAHLDYLDAVTEDRIKEIEEARAHLEMLRASSDEAQISERERLVAALAEADLEFQKVNAPWSRTSQVLEVTRDTYEKKLGLFGPDNRETKAAHQQVLDEEEQEAALLKEKEHWEDQKKQLETELRALDAPIRTAEKRLADLEQVAIDAIIKDRSNRGVLPDDGRVAELLRDVPVVSSVINAPFLDFVAPKNTASRQQVNQLVLPDVRQRLNYLETYTTDRCTTCHVAIDNPDFSQERLAQKLERSVPAINEALLRDGKPAVTMPPPPAGADGATLPVGRVTEFWAELSEEARDNYFDALLKQVNDYLKGAGRKPLELGQPLLAHPDLNLFVTVDSPHPMAKLGCTVCHEGNPQETDFVLAAHSPGTHKIEERWKEEYYDRQLGVPTMTFATVEHYWDRLMRLPKYTEGGCAKCHTRIADISRFEGERYGQRLNLGEHLFVDVGCVNCHVAEGYEDARRVGPDLTSIAAKLKPGFVQQWAFFPQQFRPSTRMPHFFGQENNAAGSENSFDTTPELRTQTEVAAISKYLYSVSRPWQPIEKPADVRGDADRGRELFTSAGCLACHGNLAEFGEEWITTDLMRREGIKDLETATYRYKGMTAVERERYAMAHFVSERDTFLDPDESRFDADREYNTPIFSRFAPELSGIGSKVTFDWLYSWLIQPTHYTPTTKMPSLRLTPGDAADLATYLLTLKNDAFEQFEFELNSDRLAMVDELMFTLLSSQRSERRSRAIMADENGELSGMLVSLVTSRSIDEAGARGIVDSMSLLDKRLMYVGVKSISHYGCYACHDIPGFEETTAPGTELTTWAEKPVGQLDFAFYDHAFHGMRHDKEEIFGHVYPSGAKTLNYWSPTPDDMPEQITLTHAAFAKHKMLNPRIWDREKLKRPYDKLKMPNFYFSEEEAEALTTFLLSRLPARVTDSVAVDYDGTVSGAIAKGRKLTRELNCVACHQIEDNYPIVQQYFRRDSSNRASGKVFDTVNAPPSLRGEGAKLQHNWFHLFLQQVEPLRPWLAVRMPSFNIDPDEATVLVEYFAAMSQDDSARLAEMLAKVDEYVERKQGEPGAGEGAGADWYTQTSLEHSTEALSRYGVERGLVRARDIDMRSNSSDRLAEAHAVLRDRASFIQALYDVDYPFVEPPSPLSPTERFDLGMRFLGDMGCLKCHVMGEMLPGPAKNTDDFVQMYRLDGVRGSGDDAVVILNGTPYPIHSKIDGHEIISGTYTVYEDTGDVDVSAIVEGPGPSGETERIMLVAASAPNLSLTYKRLRREWVFQWMLEPGVIQPGTKMPQNFAGGVSPFEGDSTYPGTGIDHINLLVDALFDGGQKSVRVPLLKISADEEPEESFDEDEGGFDDDDFDD